jgi:hypothetical protein
MSEHQKTSTSAAPARELFLKLIQVLFNVLVNAVLAAFLIGMMRVTLWAVSFLWHSDVPMLFDRVPITYVFNFFDFSILVVFMASSTVELVRFVRGFGGR